MSTKKSALTAFQPSPWEYVRLDPYEEMKKRRVYKRDIDVISKSKSVVKSKDKPILTKEQLKEAVELNERLSRMLWYQQQNRELPLRATSRIPAEVVRSKYVDKNSKAVMENYRQKARSVLLKPSVKK